MYPNTDSVPTDFGELISRFAPPVLPDVSPCRPVVASATELPDDGPASKRRMWVIMHTITSESVQLYHAQPLRSRKLAVRVDGPTGEIVQVLLAVASTNTHGDLYETTANFYR